MMSFKKFFDYAKKIGFSDVEFKVTVEKNLSIGVFHHKVEDYTVSSVETYNIRGIYNGNMVSGSTENRAYICTILDEMAKDASIIEEKKEQEIFAGSPSYKRKKSYVNEVAKLSVQEKINYVLDLEKKCYEYDPRVVDTEMLGYKEQQHSLTILNSKGLRLHNKTSVSVAICGVVVKQGDETKVGFEVAQGLTMKDLDAAKLAKAACDEALNQFGGQQCKSGKYKTILRNDVFATFLGIWMNALDGDAVNKGKSLLKDQLNKKVMGHRLTVVEDPYTALFPFLDRNFDDEGVATNKKYIVNKGVLKTFLYNMEAAKAANTESTGNGYGKTSIGVSTAFLNVKPGKKSLEELAAGLKKGVIITDVAGTHAGMNPMSGNFSLQANGYYVENGKIAYPLNLITIAGNLYEMMRDIKDIGNDNKLSFSGIYAPSVVIGKLAISGK